MVVGIYNPYQKTLGGGEQYLFTIAAFFLANHHTVIYFSDDPQEVQKAQERFGLNLKNIQVRPPVFQKGNWRTKFVETHSLDILLFYSDGSIPFSFSKKTYLIFQFPVPWVNNASLVNQIKLKRISGVIVNSEFTKRFIDKKFQVNSHVIYPSINLLDYSVKTKENIILSVGRFTKGMNMKRHDILIDAFKMLGNSKDNDWKLYIVGGVLPEDHDVVMQLQERAKGYSIIVQPNITRQSLLDLYSRASFYWHAAGYGVNEEQHPELVEHFGITTLEAMASGAIPFVFPAGGQKEIVEKDISGYYWLNPDELIQQTRSLMENKKKMLSMQKIIFDRVHQFDRNASNVRLSSLFI